MHARMFYTAESLGILDVMHNKIFKAFHLDRKQMNTEAEIFELFQSRVSARISLKTVLGHLLWRARSTEQND